MGISLTDLGNFVTGAIERDREITKENLAIRADELAANRDFLIKQKEKKYDKELEEYYKEKTKFDSIQSANADFASGTIDARSYATKVLPMTTPNWNQLSDDMKEDMVNKFDGKTFDYKLVGSEDEINKQAANIITQINNETSKAIKDAKGNSFLINKILGQKEKAEAEVLKEIESRIKASDAVKLSEQNVNQENVGIPVKVSTSTTAWNNDPNSDKYQTEWAKQRDKIDFDILSGDKALRFLNSTAVSGGSDELSYKFDKTDSRIVGMNAPSIAHVEAMRYMFNGIKNQEDQMIDHYNNVTNLYGNIGKTWNEEKIFQKMEKEIADRSGNIKQGFGTPKPNIRLTTVVPLSIVPLGTKYINNEGTDVTRETLKNLNNQMNAYILEKTKVLKDSGNFKDLNDQQIATLVYQRLYQGDKQYISEFIGEPVEPKNQNNKGENQGENDGEGSNKDTPSNFKLSPNGDSFVIKSSGEEVSFASVLENNEEDKLPAELVSAYTTWKSKQEGGDNTNTNKNITKGTSYADIQKQVEENNKKIKESFTDFEGNMKDMKSNNQFGNQNPYLKSSS